MKKHSSLAGGSVLGSQVTPSCFATSLTARPPQSACWCYRALLHNCYLLLLPFCDCCQTILVVVATLDLAPLPRIEHVQMSGGARVL